MKMSSSRPTRIPFMILSQKEEEGEKEENERFQLNQ